MIHVIVENILTQGRTVRPWIGIAGDGLTQEVADSLGLRTPNGVLVMSIHRGSPGEATGLRSGDVVLSVNDHEVADVGALRYRLATLPVGSTATLKVLRSSVIHLVILMLIAPPDSPPREITEIKGRNPFSGAIVANLNPAVAEELGLDFNESDVIVVRVRQRTPAESVSLRPGDVILEINDDKVSRNSPWSKTFFSHFC